MAVSGTFILGLFQSKEIVGYYTAIDKIVKAFNGLLATITQAIFPYISSQFGKSYNQGIESVKKSSWYVISLSIIVSILMFVFSNEIITILYGTEYIKYAVIMKSLSLWIILGVINNMIGIQYLVASGNGSDYSKALLVSVTITLILYISLTSYISYFAIIIGMLLGESLLTLYMLNIIRRNKIKRLRKEVRI